MALKFANEMADNWWQMSLTVCVHTHPELQCEGLIAMQILDAKAMKVQKDADCSLL